MVAICMKIHTLCTISEHSTGLCKSNVYIDTFIIRQHLTPNDHVILLCCHVTNIVLSPESTCVIGAL